MKPDTIVELPDGAMKEPSKKSIQQVLDMLTSYKIIYAGRIDKGEFDQETWDYWESHAKETIDYLNWIAYRDEDWYNKTR